MEKKPRTNKMTDTKKLSNGNEKGLEKSETSKKEELTKILQNLRKIGQVVGSSIISTDGLLIASDLGGGIEADTFAAMSAAMLGAAETAASELKQGSIRQVIVEAEEGKIIAISAGEKAILVILAKPELKLGLALLELGKASNKISESLGEK